MANGGDVIYHFKGDTTDLDKKTKSTSSSLKGLGKVGSTALAGLATASVVAGTAIVGMMTKSVKEYAKLEQSIGGVETLFKNSANTVIANSKKAYQTAGIDANTYMEQVTSFSASLLQSLGGDTKKASQVADMAIIDMADNANKMGTSIESIQNAYQGFAKQNYTMLDNLKLGYGGTRGEMERLLADAEKITGIHYDISNLNDVYQAIHVIQGELGITGTTAKEASSTIQGSMSAMQSAFTNFLNGSGGIKEVIDTMITFGKNVGKAILKMAPDIIQGLVELINQLVPMIPVIIQKLVPPLLKGVVDLVNSLVVALPKIIQQITDMLPTLIPMVIQAILKLIPALAKSLPLFIKAGMDLVFGLIQGLVSEESINSIIDALPEIIETLITGLMEAVPMLLLQSPRITMALATGMIKAIPKLVAKLPQIVNAIVNGIKKGIGRMGNVGADLIKGLWNGIKGLKDWVVNKVKALGKSIIKGLKGILGIHSPSTEFAIIGKYSILGYTEALDKMKGEVQEAVSNTFGLSPQLIGSSSLNYSPNVIVNNNIDMKTDPLGQVVGNIKTFSGGAKNDYNYGMGV